VTTPVADLVELDGRRWTLLDADGDGLFDPVAHGLTPRSTSTGCWRGFRCCYALRGDRLVLAHLRITLPAAQAVPLAGRVPVRAGGWDASWGDERTVIYDELGSVDFTGGLLLGDGPLRDQVAPHEPWKALAYERVVELVLERGARVGGGDRSAAVAELRAALLGAPSRVAPVDADDVLIDEEDEDDGVAVAAPSLSARPTETEQRAWVARTFRRRYLRALP
jgi:hypothetical protein